MLLGQPLGDLVQRDVLLFRYQAEDEGLVDIQLRASRLTLPARTKIARRPPLPVPRPRRRDPDRKPPSRSPRRQSSLDRIDHTPPKVQAQRTRHIRLPITLRTQNHGSSALGIPFRDSEFAKAALA